MAIQGALYAPTKTKSIVRIARPEIYGRVNQCRCENAEISTLGSFAMPIDL